MKIFIKDPKGIDSTDLEPENMVYRNRNLLERTQKWTYKYEGIYRIV